MNPGERLDQAIDKDLPLKEDIRLLGRLLGDTLREQEGAAPSSWSKHTPQRVELPPRRRSAAAGGSSRCSAARATRPVSGGARVHLLFPARQYRRGPPPQTPPPAHQLAGSPPQPGSIALALERARAAGIGREATAAFFAGALVSPVLTAHPTEVQRKSILDCQMEIARLARARDRVALTPEEARDNDGELRRVILTLWQTRIVPVAADGARRDRERARLLSLHVPAAVAAALRGNRGPAGRYLRSGRGRVPALRMGNWIGGDRDGNPYVTAELTLQAVQRQSALAFDFYQSEVRQLGVELSQTKRVVDVSPALEALADASPDRSEHRRDEPYRRALSGIYARLAATARAHGHEPGMRHPSPTPRPIRAARTSPPSSQSSPNPCRARRGADRPRAVAPSAPRVPRYSASTWHPRHAPDSTVHEQVVAELFRAAPTGRATERWTSRAPRALLEELALPRPLRSPFVVQRRHRGRVQGVRRRAAIHRRYGPEALPTTSSPRPTT